MTAQKWLLTLLVVLQDISVIHHVNADCQFGSAADEGSPQSISGLYADLQNPLSCSGHIVAWHLCFYTDNVLSTTAEHTAYLRVYRSENRSKLLRIHEVEKRLTLNPQNRSNGSFICMGDTLEQDQYLNVSEGDILAAYLPPTAQSLLIVGTDTPGSLYKDTRNPALSFIFEDLFMSTLMEVDNSALHLYANVATTDQLMPSLAVVQPSGLSNSSNAGNSDDLGSGGVAAIATVICLLFLVVLPVAVVFTVIFWYRRGSVKNLRKSILKKKGRSFSIDNMTYATNPDIRLIRNLKRNGTLKLSPSDELHAAKKAFKGSRKGKDANSDELFYEQGIAEVFNIYATLKPSTSEFRRTVKKVVKGLNRKQATPYYMPASDEEQIHQQISGQDVPSIPAKDVQRVGHLGSGQFASVEKAVWLTKYCIMEVAVKTLHRDASAGDKVKLLQEAAIMAQFYHPNVVFLHGIINEDDKTSLVMEFVSKGDLRGCLLKLKPNPGDTVGTNTAHGQLLLSYSHQIALGMLYLSDKGFVHRDLAARNVLVSDKDICKIADFGMSRDLADAEYYISEGGTIPIRWTAPEAVYYRKYSTASDVWSYGCLLYEIWSLGNKPFANCSNTQVLKEISVGFRLPPPPGCPRRIYEIMTKCWSPFHSKRPSFEDILEFLLEDEQRVLEIPLEDAATHPLASCLGATVESGHNMYRDLQMLYLSESTPSRDRPSVHPPTHELVRIERSPAHKCPVAEYATLEKEDGAEYDTVERELEVAEYSGDKNQGPKYQNVCEDNISLDEALYSKVREVKNSITNDTDVQLNHHEYDSITDNDRTNAVHNMSTCDLQDIPFLKRVDRSGHPPLPPKPSPHILRKSIGVTKREMEESDHYEFATGWSRDSSFEATPNVVINNDYLVV